jgi:hypothetical protein
MVIIIMEYDEDDSYVDIWRWYLCCWCREDDDKSGGDGVVSYHKSNMLSWSNISIYDFSISLMVMITDDDDNNCGDDDRWCW